MLTARMQRISFVRVRTRVRVRVSVNPNRMTHAEGICVGGVTSDIFYLLTSSPAAVSTRDVERPRGPL